MAAVCTLPSLSVWAGALHGWVWPSLARVVYVLLDVLGRVVFEARGAAEPHH